MPSQNSMLLLGAIIVLVCLGFINSQETGVGLGTCTYNFVVQSPYCEKDVGADVSADIQRLQDTTNKLKTTDTELAAKFVAETTALKSDIEALKRENKAMKTENSAMKTDISLLRSRLTASVGETVTAKPLPATVIEGLTYIFLGCISGMVNDIVHFVPTLLVPTITHTISVNKTAPTKGTHLMLEITMSPFPVYCWGGLYIVVQRRTAPFDLSFNRTWDEYKNGFGDLNGEFWLGLEKLYRITNQPYVRYMLRIEKRYASGNLDYKEYNDFYIGDESEGYTIEKSSGYYGSYTFFTFDKDKSDECGLKNNGYWYSSTPSYECRICMTFNPNIPKKNINQGFVATEIKIRPIGI